MSIEPPQTGQRGYSYRYNCGMAHNIRSYLCLQRLLCLSHHLPVSGIHPVSIERLKHISAVIRVHTVHRWILRKYPVDPQLLIIQPVRLSAQPSQALPYSLPDVSSPALSYKHNFWYPGKFLSPPGDNERT